MRYDFKELESIPRARQSSAWSGLEGGLLTYFGDKLGSDGYDWEVVVGSEPHVLSANCRCPE